MALLVVDSQSRRVVDADEAQHRVDRTDGGLEEQHPDEGDGHAAGDVRQEKQRPQQVLQVDGPVQDDGHEKREQDGHGHRSQKDGRVFQGFIENRVLEQAPEIFQTDEVHVGPHEPVVGKHQDEGKKRGQHKKEENAEHVGRDEQIAHPLLLLHPAFVHSDSTPPKNREEGHASPSPLVRITAC